MRGAWSVAIVISLGAAITMFQMGGLAAYFGPGAQYQTDDALETQGANLDPNEGVEGSASQQEGSIVGLIVGGSQAIFTFLGAVILLPFEMARLGFPWWFAYPVGLILQMHASVTGIQFTLNRVLA